MDRTEGLSPEGDTVTVSGIGHDPGSRLEVSTWAVPAGAATDADPEADPAPVHDADDAVAVDVGGRGTFTVTLDTDTGFAVDAGLDTVEDLFEIRLVEVGPAPEATEPPGPTEDSEGTRPPNATEDTGETDAADVNAADTEAEDAAATDGAHEDASTAPGAGTITPVLLPRAPAPAPVVGRVPITFAAPETAPNTQPQPHTRPRTQTTQPRTTAPTTRADPTLSVSQTTGLDPDGQTVTVTGTGYDTSKGIYVALCDISRAGADQAPSPCIGGVDMDGSSGSSVWVSSNPPPYGEGLAVPYDGGGADGGFSVELTVRAGDANTDCTDASTECAVVTRNDHTRSSDRSQDVFVPITFSGQGGTSQDGSDHGSGSGGSGSDSGSGSDDSGSDGSRGAVGGGNEGIGELPTTGSALWALVLTAVVTTATGATALIVTRRRRDTAAT
ncbi:hypothetical protein [Nocardiopsis lucentensis]|uniref:hypothetical protein n=1 Tax=Nocardiopsis lucentensis TaxID=53441 RepID=UPI00034532AA|nr:hypothetical protein [Nocardiopsis lucentensis]